MSYAELPRDVQSFVRGRGDIRSVSTYPNKLYIYSDVAAAQFMGEHVVGRLVRKEKEPFFKIAAVKGELGTDGSRIEMPLRGRNPVPEVYDESEAGRLGVEGLIILARQGLSVVQTLRSVEPGVREKYQIDTAKAELDVHDFAFNLSPYDIESYETMIARADPVPMLQSILDRL